MNDCTPLFDQTLATLLQPCVTKHFKIPYNNTDLTSWLHDSKKIAVSPPDDTSILYVMGNEASDLDSCVSSISYAYACHVALSSPFLAPLLPQQVIDDIGANPMRPLPQGSAPRKWVAVPVINIPQEDLSLRSVVTRLTRLASIDEDSLLFYPDAEPAMRAAAAATASTTASTSSDSASPPARACLALVDHCALAPSQQALAPLVAAILDHHDDQAFQPHAAPRVVTPCASTASLVALVVHQRLTAALAGPGLVPPPAPPLSAGAPVLQLLRSVVWGADPAQSAAVEARLAALQGFPLLPAVLAATLAAAALQAVFPSRLARDHIEPLRAALAPGPHPVAAAGPVALGLGDLLACAIAVDSVGYSAAAAKRVAADDGAVRLLGWSQWLVEHPAAPVKAELAAAGCTALHRVPVFIGASPRALCVDAAGDLQNIARDAPCPVPPHPAPARPPLTTLFTQLSALLLDTAALSSDQCLRLDVKVVEAGEARAVMSSVPRLLGVWGEAPDFLGAVLEYYRRVRADALVLCCLHIDKQPNGAATVTRDIAVIGRRDSAVRERVEQALLASSACLEPHTLQTTLRARMAEHSMEDCVVNVYSQGDVRQSRKQLLPLVKAALENCA